MVDDFHGACATCVYVNPVDPNNGFGSGGNKKKKTREVLQDMFIYSCWSIVPLQKTVKTVF